MCPTAPPSNTSTDDARTLDDEVASGGTYETGSGADSSECSRHRRERTQACDIRRSDVGQHADSRAVKTA